MKKELVIKKCSKCQALIEGVIWFERCNYES